MRIKVSFSSSGTGGAALVALLLSGISNAQQPARTTTERSFDEIVVTATRREQSLLQVPAAVTTVDAQQIEARGALTLAEALVGTPSLRVTDYSDGFSAGLQIRSLGESGHFQNAELLVLVDGIPQLNANSQAFFDQVPFDQVERIEIVRGPSSALYGRNAIAGTVNIITKRPADEPHAAVELTAGSFGLLKPRLTASGALGTGVWALASASFEQRDGWRHDTRRRLDDAFLKLGWDLSSDFTLVATFQYLDLQQRLGTQVPLRPDGTALPVSRRANFNLLPDHDTFNTVAQLGLRFDRHVSDDLDLTLIAYYRDTERLLQQDGSFIEEIDEANSLLFTFPFDSALNEQAFGIEPRLTWEHSIFDRAHRLTVGAAFERSTGTSPAAFIETDGSDAFGALPVNYVTGEANVENVVRLPNRDGRFDIDTYGTYLQSELDITERTTLTAGLRFDEQSRSLVDPLRNSNRHARFHRVTPRVALNRQLSEQAAVYLSYSEGFNPPFGAAFQFDRAGVENLRPENARNYEVGLRASLLDGRALFSSAVFHLERRDLVQTVRMENQSVQVNAGALDVSGIELEVESSLDTLFPGLSGRANYSFTRPEWKQFVLNGTDFAGRQPVNVARHLASLGLDWESNNEEVEIGAWIDYVGSTWGDRHNTARIEPYQVLSARLGYAPRWMPSLNLNVQALNLLDEDYFTRTELDFGGNVISGSPGYPRSFRMTASYAFR